MHINLYKTYITIDHKFNSYGISCTRTMSQVSKQNNFFSQKIIIFQTKIQGSYDLFAAMNVTQKVTVYTLVVQAFV